MLSRRRKLAYALLVAVLSFPLGYILRYAAYELIWTLRAKELRANPTLQLVADTINDSMIDQTFARELTPHLAKPVTIGLPQDFAQDDQRNKWNKNRDAVLFTSQQHPKVWVLVRVHEGEPIEQYWKKQVGRKGWFVQWMFGTKDIWEITRQSLRWTPPERSLNAFRDFAYLQLKPMAIEMIGMKVNRTTKLATYSRPGQMNAFVATETVQKSELARCAAELANGTWVTLSVVDEDEQFSFSPQQFYAIVASLQLT